MLKDVRISRGMSQSEAAEAAQINPRMYQMYEQGVRDINGAKLSTLLKLCNGFGCRLSDIITDAETLEQIRAYEAPKKRK